MAMENVQFLLSRFASSLEEEDKNNNRVSLYKQFLSVKDELQRKVTSCVSNEDGKALEEWLHDLNHALARCQTLSKNHVKGGVPPYLPRQLYSLGETNFLLPQIARKLKKITRNLSRITDASPRSASMATLIEERRTSEVGDTSNIVGFDDKIENILRSLQKEYSNGFKSIGIVGMPGSGKTTLAHSIFNNEIVRIEYKPRIWVPMSLTYNKGDLKRNVVQYLLQELGDKEHSSSSTLGLDQLLFNLHRQLSGKKYLIVLDDVWHIDDWYEQLSFKLPREEERRKHLDKRSERLAYGLPKGYGGGIIVTSRIERIVERMVGEDNLHRILPFHPDSNDCWSIFMNTIEAGREVDHYYPILTSMKDEILEKCGGLPWAAKILGQVFVEHIREGKVEEIILPQQDE